MDHGESPRRRIISVTMFLCSCAALSAAQGADAGLVGSIGGPQYAIAARGHHVFVGDTCYLTILDVSHPEKPRTVSRTFIPGKSPSVRAEIIDVRVDGSTVYVTLGRSGLSHGLSIIDVSNLAKPQICSLLRIGGRAAYIEVRDSLFYANNGDLTICDVSDPFKPEIVGSSPAGRYASAISQVGLYAYVTTWGHTGTWLQIFDISNPARPVKISHDGPGQLGHMHISGRTGFRADPRFGLGIYDISSPTKPVLLGMAVGVGRVADIATSGPLAFAACGNHELSVVDISNPAEPKLLSRYRQTMHGIASDVEAFGSMLAMANGYDGVKIFDVSDPRKPVLRGEYDPPGFEGGGGRGARKVSVSGSLACLLEGVKGLKIFDVSDPSAPILVGTFSKNMNFTDIATSGSLVYALENFTKIWNLREWERPCGLRIIDISDPSSPTLVGSRDLDIESPGYFGRVVLSGSRAYLSGVANYAVDVSSPSAPVSLGRCSEIPKAESRAAVGLYEYSVDPMRGLLIYKRSGGFPERN